jgi:hypothetical protein
MSGFNSYNPAKKIKENLLMNKKTKNILFGGFETFKNWDT